MPRGARRARLYATAHGLYEVEIERRRVGDDAMSPGWTVYQHRLRYYTYDVTDLLAPGAQRHRSLARRRLVPRAARLARRLPEPVRHRPLAARPARTHLRRRLGGRSSPPTPTGGPRRVRSSAPATTTARCTTPGGARRLVRARFRRRRLDAGGRARTATPPRWSRPTARPCACTEERAPGRRCCTPPSGKRVLDFGQNLVGRLRIRLTGPRGQRSRHPRPPRCCRTARSTPGRCAAPAVDRHVHRSPAGRDEEWEPRFTFHGFRYAEVDRLARRPGGGRGRRRRRRPRSTTPTWSAPAGSTARTRWSTGCTRTSSGACGATSSTSPPTARSATNASAGPATSRSSRPPRPSSTTSPGCCSLARDVAAEQLPDGTVPWYVPVIPAHDVDADPPGCGVGRRRRSDPVDAVRALRRRRDPGSQYESAKRWVDLVDRLAGPDRLWDRASSSATGSTRPRRRMIRPTPHRPLPGGHGVLRPVRAPARRHGRGAGTRRGWRALRAPGRRRRDRVRRPRTSARTADDQRRADGVRAGDRVRPAPREPDARPGGASPNSSRRPRQPHRAPGSWAPRWSPTPSRATGHADAAYDLLLRGGARPGCTR